MSQPSPITIAQPGRLYSHHHPKHKFHTPVPTIPMSQTSQPYNVHNTTQNTKITRMSQPSRMSQATGHYSQHHKNFTNVPSNRAMSQPSQMSQPTRRLFSLQKQPDQINRTCPNIYVSKQPTDILIEQEKFISNVPTVPDFQSIGHCDMSQMSPPSQPSISVLTISQHPSHKRHNHHKHNHPP